MKKQIVSIVLVIVLLLMGCATSEAEAERALGNAERENQYIDSDGIIHVVVPEDDEADETPYEYAPDFQGMDSPELSSYIEDEIYSEIVKSLGNDKFYVEGITTSYISQEYLDELEFNSQANVFFGHTLSELDEQFQGARYVFSLSDDGTTEVREFEEYDDTFEKVITNVAIGAGVILVCVTVSVVTAGAGAPAVAMIFAAAAKTGTAMALSSAAIGSVSAGIVTGMQTGDMDEALKAAALAGSEGFKWGAITGAISGGATEGIKYVKAMGQLKDVPLYLTKQEAAAIQMQTKYPVEIISQFHTMEEFEVFQQAGLEAQMVNGELALIRHDIDLHGIVDEFGMDNVARMQLGKAPIGIDNMGNVFKYELHHIGQEADATLAILTQAEHDSEALHGFKVISEIDRGAFDSIRRKFWKSMARILGG